jgi:hypothetical protein
MHKRDDDKSDIRSGRGRLEIRKESGCDEDAAHGVAGCMCVTGTWWAMWERQG